MTTSGKPPITWTSVDLAGSTAKAFSKECRNAPRYRCAGGAEIAIPGAAAPYRGQLFDLSLTGCRMLLAPPLDLEKSTAVEILLDIDGLKLRLPAKVVRSGKREGTALRFGSLSPRNSILISNAINEVAAKAEEAGKKRTQAAAPVGAKPK